ncbi:MAG TPA: AbrB/MazE/SpoVT family DNA-binding domain-containing protein [Candidatus Fraserbacteria bacterium]|nr:AbrB/MazE/SpoVT family DNA-binding domain-containing protein [Candidatus Fraserbacteria bacterium]
MPTAKVTSKGQITVPKEVREQLGISAGDELEFISVNGEYRIRRFIRHSPFDRYRGYLKQLEGRDPDQIVRKLRGHG